MKWVNSSSQHQPDALTPAIQSPRQNLLHNISLAVWMGTSDVSIESAYPGALLTYQSSNQYTTRIRGDSLPLCT